MVELLKEINLFNLDKMKNLLIILIVLIASGGCSDSGDIKAVDVKKVGLKVLYKSN